MPGYIRWRESGAVYFFTVVTYRRRRILTSECARSCLREAISHVRSQRPFENLAFVLLPDHLHCIWALPEGDDDFPTRWRLIKSRFTRRYLHRGGRSVEVSSGAEKERRRGVWQGRYWEHCIRDERDLERHRDYIHLNPVHHGYVEKPEDWAWSSFHRYVREGWLDAEWPGVAMPELPDVPE